ncbi:XRE family transcriptional regulator [Pseudomonas sp. Marseille-QA0332]
MIKANEVAEFYEVQPTVSEARTVHANRFISLMETSKETVMHTYDKLAYLAGIKSAPLQDQYRTLDTSSLQSLLRSAKQAGFNAHVISL